MKILVSGGTTFVSKFTAEYFLKRNNEVYVINRNSREQVLGVHLIESDRMNPSNLLKNEHFDLMILDFIMTPFHGDQVVEEIRKFNKDLYILLLTGHKDLAPPLETIKRLDIQG